MLGDSADLHRSHFAAADLVVLSIFFRVRRVTSSLIARPSLAPTLPPADPPPRFDPPDPPPPPPGRPAGAHRRIDSGRGPYAGDFRLATWNAQGLFAECPDRRRAKRRQVRQLLQDHDIVVVTETHSTPEMEAAHLRNGQAYFDEFPSFWAHGTAARAGVGIVAHESFLQRFGLQRDWRMVVPGRALELHLSGDMGDISIFGVYFATGTDEVDETNETISARTSRHRMRRSVANCIAPAERRLSLILGDFNWVADDLGRLQLDREVPSGGRDRGEERHFEQLLHPRSMTLWRHPAYTHRRAGILSRLDCCYTNLHPSCFLQERVGLSALDWPHSAELEQDLSTHRPVSVFRHTPPPMGSEDVGRRLPPELGRSKLWQDRTRSMFVDRLAGDTSGQTATPFGRLRLLKEAMTEAAASMKKIGPQEVGPGEHDERLSWAMRGLRALQHGSRDVLHRMVGAVPELACCLDLPEAQALRHLQDKSYEFAKTLARSQLEAVQTAVSGGEAEPVRRGLRHRALQTLRRLRPRAEGSLSAIRLPDGQVTTDMARAAPVLTRHWAEQFRAKGVSNEDAVDTWCADMPKFSEVMPRCEVTKEHIIRAIKAAGATAPGPDGIPYSFWQGLGEVGVTVLYDTLMALMEDGSETAMLRDYGSGDNRFGDCDFNGSLLVLLPKKPTGHDAVAGAFYDPADTRPLMLVDTSNRLLASALRFAIEPAVERLVGAGQRGFLNGRSILANVLDLEVAMQQATLEDEEPYTLLFDMRAAFPSLEHDYLHRVLEKLGVPSGIRAAIRALYAGQSCCLSMAGKWWEGFAITAGIRQGCPLSPLLFVLVTEPFNRRLDVVEGRRERCAFADDLALVGANGRRAWPQLRVLFSDFAAASGLHLNLAKTVLLPLWTWQSEVAAAAWRRAVPEWESVRVAHSGPYLGFEVGPAAADISWVAPIRKFKEAVSTWAANSPGMHLTTLAYNMYAVSRLQYVAQLHGEPPGWQQLEKWAIQRLFPGPAGWLPQVVAQSLRDEFGMPSQVQSLATAGPAAMLRVALSGADHRRRLRLEAIARALAQARRQTSAWDIEWRWKHWFDHGPVQRLRDNMVALATRGITERTVLEHGLGNAPRPATHEAWRRAQRRLQSSATTLLRRQQWLQVGMAQFSSKVRKWRNAGLLPGRRAGRCLRVMQKLPKKTPPRVRAAVLRTWLGGWCTDRRFGRRGGSCAFGCPLGEDALAHYVCCPQLWRFGAARLGLTDPGDPATRTTRALLWCSAADNEEVTRTAMLMAVGYKAHNVLRHRTAAMPLAISRLFDEILRQLRGAQGV